MIMPALYHWAPRSLYHEIARDGLKIYVPPTVSTGAGSQPGTIITGWPYLCFGTTPSAAWGLSGNMDYVSEIEEWDLWQAQLAPGDEVHYRSDFGNQLKEVRVHNGIPADRIWWVATRTPQAALEAKPKPARKPRARTRK